MLHEQLLMSRRRFIRSGIYTTLFSVILGTTLGTAMFGAYENYCNKDIYDPSNPEIFLHKHPLPPGATKPFAIVHLTDIHFDTDPRSAVNPKTLPPAVSKVKRVLAQLGFNSGNTIVTCTGDWVNGTHEIDGLDDRLLSTFNKAGPSDLEEFPTAVKMLRSIPGIPIGTLGNHDFKHPDRDEVTRIITSGGFQLIDQTPFQPFKFGNIPVLFMGAPDYTDYSDWYQDSDNLSTQAGILSGLRGDNLAYYLTHNPAAFDPNLSLLSKYLGNLKGLSGHTHWLNFPTDTLTGLIKRYIARLKLGYESNLIAGHNVVVGDHGNIQVLIPPGLGQHPLTPTREVPAGFSIHIFG